MPVRACGRGTRDPRTPPQASPTSDGVSYVTVSKESPSGSPISSPLQSPCRSPRAPRRSLEMRSVSHISGVHCHPSSYILT